MDKDFNQEKIFDKMRELRDKRDIKILNEPLKKDANSQEKVLDVKYLGQVESFGDVYLVTEQRQDRNGNLYQVERYETEDGKLIGGNNKSDAYDFILLSENYKEREDLLEQLQELNKEGILDLNEMEQGRLEAVAKELGIKVEEIERVVEIDPEKEIKTKKERKAEKEEPNSEKENEIQEKDTFSSEELESVSSKTEIDVNQKVTDSETMASLLNVQDKGYKKFQVVESNQLQEGNSTRFSFVGIKEVERKDPKTGKIHKVEVAEKIDTLEQRYGQSPNKGIDSLSADGSKLEEKKMQSIYQVKGDNENQVGVNIGSAGNLEVSYIRTPRQNNAEAISIPIETYSVRPITREVREFMNKNRNTDVEEESERIAQHREAGCEDINMRNIDDDEENNDHNHDDDQAYIEISDEYLDQLVEKVFEEYEELRETYNREDIKDKLKEVIEEKGQIPEEEKIIEEVGTELEENAKREHELPRNSIEKEKDLGNISVNLNPCYII